MKKFILSIASLIGMVSVADATPVISLTIEDVGSGLPGEYSSVLDGFSGAFRFSKINDIKYKGASLFYGDVAADPGGALGEIDTSQANPVGSFTTGFIFASTPFVPLTLGPIVADISIVGGVPVMTIDSLPYGGEFQAAGGGTLFPLGPQDSNPADCAGSTQPWFPLSVSWLNQIDATSFNYKIGWSHCITREESASFGGIIANWRLEGVATVSAVPVPAAVWLFGSGLLGLVGVARRRK